VRVCVCVCVKINGCAKTISKQVNFEIFKKSDQTCNNNISKTEIAQADVCIKGNKIAKIIKALNL
jgi:hypothetical protein